MAMGPECRGSGSYCSYQLVLLFRDFDAKAEPLVSTAYRAPTRCSVATLQQAYDFRDVLALLL